jgi:2-phosphoglycerate kinase
MSETRVILIGGTSHCGKSTLARRLAARPGWVHISTDSLARHPGRPWRDEGEVPPHVVEHFLNLSDDALLESVLAHYRTMQPEIETLIRKHAENESEDRLVLEGSALWPETIVSIRAPLTATIWLTASETLLTRRMHNESRYATCDTEGKALIDKFLARTINYDRAMIASATRLGLPHVTIEDGMDIEQAAELCLANMRELAAS